MPDAVSRSARLAAGAFFIVLLALLGGCASMTPQTFALREDWPADVPHTAELASVPFFTQDEYQCGPAALATLLVHAGANVTPESLVSQVYLPARQGSLQVEMLAAPRRHGLVSYRLEARYEDLLREVAAGNPVIVLQDTGGGFITNWHYAVVVGFDYAKGDVILRSGETRRDVTSFTMLEYTWKRSNYWAMVVMPPGRLPATATEAGYLPAIAAMERVGAPGAVEAAYGAFLDRWPDSVGAGIGLANRYYARGDLANAEGVLRRAAARNPDSVVVLNNLAQTLSEQGRNAEALEVIDRAAQPGSLFAPDVRDTRTLILQRLGKPG